jgi:hypothetical protein
MGQTLAFAKTVFDEKANNGLGEWRALFSRDEGVAQAFKQAAAKPGLSLKGSTVMMSRDQIDERIGQLDPAKHGAVISELEKGRHALDTKVAPKVTAAVAGPGIRA